MPSEFPPFGGTDDADIEPGPVVVEAVRDTRLGVGLPFQGPHDR